MAKLFCAMLGLQTMLTIACVVQTRNRVGDFFFSFEDDLEGWTINAIDVGEEGGVSDDWTISRSQDMSRDGATSVKLDLANYNDAGKVWMERTFPVQANRSYQVELRFSFASADWGSANLWTLIAGVLPEHPRTIEELRPAYQGDTGNGRDSGPADFVWLDKSYVVNVQSDSMATLHVVIGVWGTYEVARTYYVDSVRVTIDEMGAQASFQSTAECLGVPCPSRKPRDYRPAVGLLQYPRRPM